MPVAQREVGVVKVHVTKELIDALAGVLNPPGILRWFDLYIPALDSTPRQALLDGRYDEVLAYAESYSDPSYT